MARAAKNKTVDNPSDHIGFLLKTLMHSLRQSTESAFRHAGLELSMTQLVTLLTVYTDPGLPGAQLAKKLFITAQSMNTVLKTLEDGGMIERHAHPDNQRAFRWYLTDAGLNKLMSSKDHSQTVFEQMQAQLSKAERLQLVDLLKRCIAGLNVAE